MRRNSIRLATLFGMLAVAMLVVNCEESDRVLSESPVVGPSTPRFTASVGTSGVFHGLATHEEDLSVRRMVAGQSEHWTVDIKAKPGLTVAAQSITFPPGSRSGWHRHPGPVLIQVLSGTMTFYESDDPNCTPIEREAGTGFLDVGDHAHIARNESDADATNLVVYFAPPGTTQSGLRIDAPDPGNCPFTE